MDCRSRSLINSNPVWEVNQCKMILGFLAIFSIFVASCSSFQLNENTIFSCRNELQVQNKSEKLKMLKECEGKEKNLPWYLNIPFPSVAVAKSKGYASAECKKQLKRYLRDLQNGTIWATQMFDSSVKYPYGIVDGHTRHLGNFDQCYRLDAKVPNEDDFSSPTHVQGRYCLVDYKYVQNDAPREFHGEYVFDFDPNDSVWEAIREKGDTRRVKRYLLQVAVCVPAVCSPAEIQNLLKEFYGEFGAKYSLTIDVTIDPKKCQAYHEEPDISVGAISYCIVVAGIVAVIIGSTLMDKAKVKPDTKFKEFILCFSASKNLETIFEVKYNHRGLDCLYSLRVICTCITIIGHRTIQYWINTVVNERYIELSIDSWPFVILHNGSIIVDAFFGFGGLLASYSLLGEFNKTKHMNFVRLTLARYLRFTPAYALIVAFFATIFPYFGSGPFWRSTIGVESERCSTNWWTNIFYVNDYVNVEEMCMFQSWYISIDLHYYILSIFAVYAFWKWPRKYGYSLFGSILFVSMAIPFYVTYVNRIQPMFIRFPHMRDMMRDPYFLYYYIKSHMRLSSYMVGIIAGAILYDYKSSKWRLSKFWSNYLFALLVYVVSLASVGIGFRFFNPNIKSSSFETALYASTHRAAFAASACSIILLITMGSGLDIQYKFLTPRWMQPLGKLTFGVYLTHNFLQAYQWGTSRAARTFSIHNLFYDFVPDVICAFSLSLLLTIAIEEPFRRISRIFILKRSEKNPNIISSTETDKKIR